MNLNCKFEMIEVIIKIGVDMLNIVEILSQKSAWYFLCEPILNSFIIVMCMFTI